MTEINNRDSLCVGQIPADFHYNLHRSFWSLSNFPTSSVGRKEKNLSLSLTLDVFTNKCLAGCSKSKLTLSKISYTTGDKKIYIWTRSHPPFYMKIPKSVLPRSLNCILQITMDTFFLSRLPHIFPKNNGINKSTDPYTTWWPKPIRIEKPITNCILYIDSKQISAGNESCNETVNSLLWKMNHVMRL